MTKTLIAALKRKDMKGIIATLLREEGKEVEAKEVEGASRITAALIDRTCVNSIEDSDKAIDPTELDYQEPINEEAAKNSELIELEKAVRKAIKKGNYKKAKKALKALKESGIEGSEIDSLTKEVKALKDK